MTTAAPEKHAKLSPSASSRWLACPYSIDAPSTPPNAAAQEGTAAHGWGSDVLNKRVALSDVPATFKEGVTLYVEHVLSNGAPPIVERFWESFTIENFGGTVDCLLYKDGMCAVYDFKYGKWPVAAENNTQLLCYSALADEHFDIGYYFGVIVQPNAFKGDKVKMAEYSPQQVATHRKRVIEASESREKHTGDHCRFCSFRTLKQCDEGMAHAKMKGWK